MLLAQLIPRDTTLLLLFAAILGLYIAGRIAIFALAPPDGSNPGWRAIAQCIPIFASAIAAVVMRQPEVAVSIIFGTSVACLSLALGATTILSPLNPSPANRRMWAFVLPAALVYLVAGFNGHLTWWHAVLLLTLGVAILAVWLDPQMEGSSTSDTPVAVTPTQPFNQAIVLVIISILLAGGASVVMMHKAPAAAANARWLSPALMATFILSPLIALPTFVTITTVGQQGHSGRALTALVGTVLLNLCLLLPLAILLQHLMPVAEAPQSFWARITAQGQPLPFPVYVWRIDSVLLVILGFLLVPVAMGRWLIGSATSLVLIFGYIVYLAADVFIVLRTHIS